MKKLRMPFVSVSLVILLMLSNTALVGPLSNDLNKKQSWDDIRLDSNSVNGMLKSSVFDQEDLVGTREVSNSQISTLSSLEASDVSEMEEGENPLLHDDVSSPEVAPEAVDSLLGANGSYQLIWEPNRVQGSVHSVASYAIDELGNGIVAIGAGYLYDNEIHIYRWDASAKTGTHVWDVGDGVIMGDVLSLTFADSDKDGFIEIVAGCADRKIYVFEQRSISTDNPLFNQFQLVWNSAKEVDARVTSVAVDDLDLDGFREIIAGSWSKKVYVYEYTARYGTPGTSLHRHWYAKVWDSGTTIKGLVNSIATGDTDADSFREIVVGCSDSMVYIFENNQSVSPEPVYPHVDNAYGFVWNSSDLIYGPVQSVAVDGNTIVASSSGHGVYVFDYDPYGENYKMNKLFRGIESWEMDEPFPIDVYADLKVSGNVTTGVFEPPDIPEPYSLLGEQATAMAGPPDRLIGNGWVSGCTTLNATATKEGVATTVVDFGNDEEITGTGNIDCDFFLEALEIPGSPVTLENFELYVSKDNINFAKVEEGIYLSKHPIMPGRPKVLYFAVDIDPTLGEERWEWFRFLKIETTTTVLVDSAKGTLNRPVSDALVVSTGYVPGLSASTTDHTIIVGTVAGNIKVFLQDPNPPKYYTHVWDSYSKIPLYQPGTKEYRRRLSLGTNIWSIDLLSREFNGQTFMVVGTYPKVSFIHVDPTTLEASVTWDTTPVLDRWTMSLAIADTDGDGKKEVVVGSFDNNIYTFEHVYRNTYRRAWRSPDLKHDETVWDHVKDLVIGDIDQDGNMEIIAATDNQSYPMVHIFENIGNDQYTAVEGIELPFNSGPITALALGNDLDNDTAVEILVAGKNTLYLFEIKDTTLTSDIIYSIHPANGYWQAQAIVTGDTDQDNYGEIIVGGRRGNNPYAVVWSGFAWIFENYGNATVSHLDNKFKRVWEAPDVTGFDTLVSSVILGDQDDDGKNEIIVGHQKGINVYENTGDNTFETSHIITSSPSYPSIQLTEITDLMPDYYPRDPREQWDEWEEPLEMSAPIVQLSNGSFIVVYTSKDPGVTEDTYHTQTRLFYRVSEDGVTWSDELRVTSDEQAIAIDPLHVSLYYERSPSIVVTPWDTVWVVFEANFWVYVPWGEPIVYLEHNPTIMTAKIGSRHPSRLDMREIVQGGFSPSIYWNSASGSPGVTYLNSTLYRGWFDPTAPRLLHLSTSTWHEVEVPGEEKPFRYLTWSVPQLLNTKIGRGYRALFQETTYLNDGSLAVVFDGFNETATKTDFDIWVTISNGTDVTVWSDPRWASMSNDLERSPSITILRDGVLMIVFCRLATAPVQWQLYVVASSDNGLSWTEPRELLYVSPFAPAVSTLTSGGFMYTFHAGTPAAGPTIYFGKNPHVGWWDFTIGSVSHLALGDTDNDTLNEIIAASDKTIYILELNATGTDPQAYKQVWISQELAAIITDLVIGDINNNGTQEIVVTAARGNVYAFEWIKEEET